MMMILVVFTIKDTEQLVPFLTYLNILYVEVHDCPYLTSEIRKGCINFNFNVYHVCVVVDYIQGRILTNAILLINFAMHLSSLHDASA